MLLIPFFKRDQEKITFIILHVLMTNDYTSYIITMCYKRYEIML